jgi:protein FAM50
MAHRGFERVGDSGVHTVEGTVAGGRAGRLTKEREADQKAYEEKKRKIEEDAHRGVGRIDDKFDRTVLNTILSGGGLQTKAEYVASQEAPPPPASADAPAAGAGAAAPGGGGKKAKRARMRARAQLSFGDDEEGEEDAAPPPKRGAATLKCPDAKTDFLPDRRRDAEARARTAALAEEWHATQARVKREKLAVVYTYYDGSSHRRSLTVEKGSTIAKFLLAARDQLVHDFPELKRMSVENLVYVKEDLVIPHHFSFHDLIVSKARGKSGPLFHFDVHDDVRIVNDARVEKDESHPGKVVLRAWFERNRHIFPASRWETFDPANPRTGHYTIKDTLDDD